MAPVLIKPSVGKEGGFIMTLDVYRTQIKF